MSESVFTSILEEWAERDWESYANAPEFRTSRKHDRVMKRIFRRYERNAKRLSSSGQKLHTAAKRLLIILVMILLAMIAGCSIVIARARTLRVEPYSENDVTRVYAIDTEGSPAYIEHEYYLSVLPEGFEMRFTHVSGATLLNGYKADGKSTYYENRQTGQSLVFNQYIRARDPILHYTGNNDLIEVEINGHSGVFTDSGDDHHDSTYILWDNGDYLISIWGNIPKEDLLNLAKSAKILEN